jgi:hypothetical protein
MASSNGQIIPLDYNTSGIDEMIDNVVPAKLLREPGPIRRVISFGTVGEALLLSSTAVVMDDRQGHGEAQGLRLDNS